MAKHLIKIQNPLHVAISIQHEGRDQQYADAGDVIKLDWQPSNGWGLQEAHYTDDNGNIVSIDLESKEFTMPDSNITISGMAKRFVLQDWTTNDPSNAWRAVGIDEEGNPVQISVIDNLEGTNAHDVLSARQGFLIGNALNGVDFTENITDKDAVYDGTRIINSSLNWAYSPQSGTRLKTRVIPVNEGDDLVIRFTNPKSATYYALLESFSNTTVGESANVSQQEGFHKRFQPTANHDIEVIVPTGSFYLYFVYQDSDESTGCTITRRSHTKGAIEKIEELEAQCAKIPVLELINGTSSVIAKSDDLSDNLIISNFPMHNSFGDKYSFGCRITTFSGLKICRGYNAMYSRWLEIDGTNVTIKGYDANTSSLAVNTSVAHGLTITTMLNININVTKEGTAELTLQTLDDSFSHTFTKAQWGYEARGPLSAINDGSVLTDCCLSIANSYITSPVWIIGSSFEGVSNNRWIGQLKNMGYFNFYLNAYPGRTGTAAIEDFVKALNFGCPKFVFFANSNMPVGTEQQEENFVANMTTMKEICAAKGIVLINYLRPDNPAHDYTERRAATIAQGTRYLDGYHALIDPSKTWSQGVDTWYEGFLGSDEVHPTEKGAASLAMQALLDFPEIQQYCK